MKLAMRILLLVLLTAAIVITGCSKKSSPTDSGDGNGGGGGVGNNTITVNLTGVVSGQVTSSNFAAVTAPGGTAIHGEFELNGQSYTLNIATFEDPPETKTYPISPDASVVDGESSCILGETANVINTWWSISGSVTYTATGSQLKGSYNIVVADGDGNNQTTLSGTFDLFHLDTRT